MASGPYSGSWVPATLANLRKCERAAAAEELRNAARAGGPRAARGRLLTAAGPNETCCELLRELEALISKKRAVSNSQQEKRSEREEFATGSEISLVLTKMAKAQERQADDVQWWRVRREYRVRVCACNGVG